METGTRLLSGGKPASPAEIPARLEALRRRVEAACGRCGRDPAGVTLVAVGKTVDLERLRRALECGVRDLGENRVQEAEEKIRELGRADWVHGEGDSGPIWHMVGHLQSNKAGRAAELFDWIHGVDSARLGEKIDRAAAAAGRTVDILLQVNLSGEPTKSGVRREEAADAARALSRLRAARLRGLMAIPAPAPDPEAMRPAFVALRELRDAIVRGGGLERPLEALSMGMSEDFEVAIEEGATHIRVGRAIFGDRPAAGDRA